ncbi:hypothetical protein ACFXO9_14950 [Nocardia tengchongensis]|uniref:hypothetical protein n=1 Tax=Nocardia tengchongensis TaxID=2055889 RepID=UPI00368FD05D
MAAVAHAQRHGGPDAQTQHLGDGWGLGADRLAIQGIAGGEQPYRLGEDLTAVFNGEIYNHVALREQLTRLGRVRVKKHGTEQYETRRCSMSPSIATESARQH